MFRRHAGHGNFSIIKNGELYEIRYAAEIPKALGYKQTHAKNRVIGQEASLREAFRAADALVQRVAGRSGTA
jgi:hypothetical protein